MQIRANGDERIVCRQAFINIHGITPGRVTHLAHFAATSPTPPVDKRGKQPNQRAKGEDVRQQIHAHIRSFPTVESHYGRAKATKGRKFLSSSLSVAVMHELYLEKYEPDVAARLGRGEEASPVVTYEYYRQYFNTHFNLSFGVPRTDTCACCDELNVALGDTKDAEEVHRLQQEKQEHLRKAQQFYAELRASTDMARGNSNMCCLSFDFEQNLPLPHIPTNDIFYLRQLWLYVFCVHNSCDTTSAMYCWPETVAHRGANEVVSCLDHYLSTTLRDVDSLTLFSDSCPGQNKNSIVMHYLFSLVRMGKFKLIRHFFPLRGHSFLPCDRDFAKTETKKRKVERVYVPDHWYEVIHSAKKKKPFTVVPVSQSMVFDYQTHLSSFLKKTVTHKGDKMKIREGMVFEYSSDHKEEVWIRYSLSPEAEWHKFPLEKKKVREISFPTEPVYTEPLQICSPKVDDLKKIVYKFVPREFRNLYDTIISENTTESSNSSPVSETNVDM